MTARLYVPLLLFTATASAYGAERMTPSYERPVGQTTLCMGSDATGYDWEGGSWVRKVFAPSQFVVKKAPVENENGSKRPINRCKAQLANKSDKSQTTKYVELQRCYTVTDFGSEPFIKEDCTEYYSEGKITEIECPGIFTSVTFQPNGDYIKRTNSMIVGDVGGEPKDSMYIEVGSCSDI